MKTILLVILVWVLLDVGAVAVLALWARGLRRTRLRREKQS